MRVVLESAGIQYGVLERRDAPGMVRLLAEVFSRSDPPAVAAGLSAAEVESLVAMIGRKALPEGLTIGARSAAGEIVGAMLTEDFGTADVVDAGAAPPRFLPIGALLDSLDDEYRKTNRVVPGSHLHLFMVGVSPSFGGLGIAQTMIRLCLENGGAKGYRRAVTEATGRTSQHIFRKLGFRELLSASYKDFVYDGRRPFESIEEHEGTFLMERGIDGASS